MLALQIVTYAAIGVSVIAMLAKVIKYATAPEHMRWELYPVPHEKGRAEYGGSYLEELDWWTKKRETDTLNELREMAAEVLLLKGVYHNNKTVWTWSLPFHFGLYLCIGWLVLLLAGGILAAFDIAVGPAAGVIGQAIHYLTIACGYAGLALSGIGAIGLFVWRMSDSDQRKYNSPMEYFNLVFFVAVSAVALTAQATLDPSFAQLREFVHSLVTFTPFTSPGTLFSVQIVMVAVLIAYIPLTRMSHFVAKYFLYHSVRWNDEPNERGSKMEARVIELLGQKIGWSAPHMGTGKTWAEAVTAEDKKETAHE
ncbi:respiratory nitrate reductase subunit gamma [bacterium]|nr:respiratory nitrate reductase subunit gamma [bacterium]MCB2202332.1 respiratory nitrate reductase subunit gamma [bacterium]